jgi:predicted MFS family arabinose efflux permease
MNIAIMVTAVAILVLGGSMCIVAFLRPLATGSPEAFSVGTVLVAVGLAGAIGERYRGR